MIRPAEATTFPDGAYPPSLPILWLVLGLMHAKSTLERRVGDRP